jgi:hypothetical protein
MYHKLGNHFGRIRRHSKFARLKWKLILVCLEIMLILTQDKYMVWAKHVMALETILDAPDGALM